MVKTATAPTKGGARNYTKSPIDIEHLTDSFSIYLNEVGCKEAFQFHEYSGLWANCGIKFAALSENCPFLMAILRVDPNCSITYSNIKSCVLNIFQKCPECKPNKSPMHAQAGDVANIAMVLQAHLRRLATGHEHEKEQENARSSLSHSPEIA